MPRKRPKDSEVHAYVFIKQQLKMLGWDVRNPERVDNGQVWTQNECLSNHKIKDSLGYLKPENIVKVNDNTLWVFEAKRSHSDLKTSLKEAEDYARAFEHNDTFEAVFISGVAGNEIDSFLVRTRFNQNGKFVPITLNGSEVTGLLTRKDLLQILETGNPDISEPLIDERLFLSRAEHINEILHLGAINPHDRAGVMAALLLSMLGDTAPNIDERDPIVLIGDINSRVRSILNTQGKPEFYDYVNIKQPSTSDNHVKLRKALVDTLQELNNLNIRSAMNSGADWLGAFYEVFLKYANWAQDLGIVLTPRHITRWVADVMDVSSHDVVLDPTCGTGGFLVAALDYVKMASDESQVSRFKRQGVFGIEQDAGLAALAVVNMIFRGDGKNNIKEGNCFAKRLTSMSTNGNKTGIFTDVRLETDNSTTVGAATKVMMNPPFALKRSDEKEHRFVEHALRQIEHGGILFSVLPYSVMVKPSEYLIWRRDSLLAENTLLAVVTFPPDLFYPVGVTTVGVFVRKGIPHPKNQNVLWMRAINDGMLKRKGRRLPNTKARNELYDNQSIVKAFLNDTGIQVPNQNQFLKSSPVDFDDAALELVPEVYLDQQTPSSAEIADALRMDIRLCLAYLIKVDRANIFEGYSEIRMRKELREPNWREFVVEDVFDVYRGHFHSIAALDSGDHITISRIGSDNGFVGLYDMPEKAHLWPSGTITVSTVTGDAFVQPVPFIATDNVVLVTPKSEFGEFKPSALMFVTRMLNTVKWRYSYGRQCYKGKYSKTKITLPVADSGDLDFEYMESMVEAEPYWPLVENAFEK